MAATINISYLDMENDLENLITQYPSLPKPTIRGYLVEYSNALNRGISYVMNHRWRTLAMFTFFYAIASFTIIPQIYQRSVVSVSEITPPNIAPTIEPTITPTPTPLNTTPAWFIVPKLNIDTSIEQVGQTRSLQMDVPKIAANVAWYAYGPKPGEDGNVVVAGHYDTPSGRPAVFYSLNKLVIGDEIKVISVDGVETVYAVVEKKFYPLKEFPDEYVFHTRPWKNLNIITCAGVWDTGANIYNQRLVIYTTIKGDST